MPKTKNKDIIQNIVDSVVNGMLEKKGMEVVVLNLGKLNSPVCDFFAICHGNSKTQALALADSVEEEVKKATKLYPLRREGHANAEWILLDFSDVVVHIFQEPIRRFYNIEGLWADAPRQNFEDINIPKNSI
jgi:ribosome-associated protein